MTTNSQALSIDTIRVLSADAVQAANAGHPGTAMALAPLAYTIFNRFLRANPESPQWPDRDRFVLSAGHACILQYTTLHLAGYAVSLEQLKRFRQWGSITPGHPEHVLTPGVETTTGPLGQGIANAVGMAMAERFLAERYNRPGHTVVDHCVYVIASDGDLMEGVSQEAASVAGQFALGKLIVCYDDNRITIDGTTAISFDREDQEQRFDAYGWHVQRVEDVNDVGRLEVALAEALCETNAPSLISIRSHIAYPAPNAQDTSKAHGAPLGENEVRRTKEVLGWDPGAAFVVPDGVYEHMSLLARGARLEAEWSERFDAWSAAFPGLRTDWDQAWSGRPSPGFADALPAFAPDKPLATRAAGQKVMHAFAQHVPTMLGGSADLAESTKTDFPGAGVFSSVHSGRNVPFGVREHAMGSIVNGLSMHGGIVKPYGATFLVFSDYMRAAVRLSALTHLPVVWVWTHDSIGLGEDGPTHQPVEHYLALRAIPNLWVIRPADANETSIAWKVALEREDGPVSLLLSRQNLPVLDRTPESGCASADGLERGAYTLWESKPGAHPDLILIGTGSEVSLALEAARTLAEAGSLVRVVSMPCWELFELEDEAYQAEVLPPDVGARLAIEAGVTLGWQRWVGDRGGVLGVDRFGASAPGGTVLAEYGFTVDNVVERALAIRERVA
ncbi:MAG: transketolase [Actinomycetia bacterium]|nr:transketolase [Actinomycetes bacterium]